MKRKKRIGVVADDVTGANDIGIMFQKGGYRAAVFPLGLLRACDCDLREEAEGLEMIIIDTDSRLDRPEDAREKVRKATELLMTLPCDMYHNKTCSVFRGNIGAEFDEMQDVLGVSCSMVILGFPENGRTTVDGIHYVYGRKLEESQFRNDPIHKMTTSSLEEILHRQSVRPAGHITWRDLDQGLAHVMEKKERLKKQCSYVIFDIRDQADLRLSALAVAEEKNICGSSAIGEELPWAIARRQSGRREQTLLLAGSLTKQSIAQIRYMKEKGCPVLEFPTQEICAEEGLEKTIQAWTKAALRKMQEKGICLLHTANAPEAVEETKRRGAAHGLSDEAVGKRISGVMCRIARSVMEESGCRKLVVAGGDTSAAVTEALKIYRMDMIREIEAGIPLMQGRSALGDIDLVLKSGSFGSEAFLEKAVQAVRRQVGEEQVE